MEVNNVSQYVGSACAMGIIAGGAMSGGAAVDNFINQRHILKNKDEFVKNSENMKNVLSGVLPGKVEEFEQVAKTGKYSIKSIARHAALSGLGGALAGAVIGLAACFAVKHKQQ